MSGITDFAGLEWLNPGEPLTTDGGAFTRRNPLVTDRLLRLGAVGHRHDAHAALANPSVAPTLTVNDTGGTIPGGKRYYIGYTLFDADGGETLPEIAAVNTSVGYTTPSAGPTALADYDAGTLLAGDYIYALTVTDGAGGETMLGLGTLVTILPGNANAEVTLGGITALVDASSGGASGAGWRLWRQKGGGDLFLIATGPRSVGTFTDNGVTGDCTVQPPNSSTTAGTNEIVVNVPAGQPAGTTQFALYVGSDSLLRSAGLLGLYAPDQLGVDLTFDALTVTLGMPPLLSSCIPGAHKLDPDTEIDSPWRQKAAYTSDLPTSGNHDGDCRVVLHDHMIYMWWSSDSSWHVYAPGGGGGGGVDGGHAEADFGLSISGGAASTDLFVADLDGGTA